MPHDVVGDREARFELVGASGVEADLADDVVAFREAPDGVRELAATPGVYLDDLAAAGGDGGVDAVDGGGDVLFRDVRVHDDDELVFVQCASSATANESKSPARSALDVRSEAGLRCMFRAAEGASTARRIIGGWLGVVNWGVGGGPSWPRGAREPGEDGGWRMAVSTRARALTR